MKFNILPSRKPFFLMSLLVLGMMVLAACAPATAPAAAPTATTAPAAAPTTAPTVAATTASSGSAAEVDVANDPKLGQILVDSKGMTLYAFTKDVADKSNCSGGCLKAWPAFTTTGAPKAGTGVDQSMLGTATLADGSMIVTYNHMPLYFWAKDQKPGDTTGQDVGKVWFVVAPDGKMVTTGSQVPVTGSTGTPMAATPMATSGAASGAASGTVLNVATDPKLGKILVDGKGMTLYIFTKDGPDKSNCTGGCAKAWPPFTATGNVTAGAGVDQSLIGTATLADGSKIVTYNHMPLYYWASDTKPGDTTGQGVQNVWFVVSPDGKPVQ